MDIRSGRPSIRSLADGMVRHRFLTGVLGALVIGAVVTVVAPSMNEPIGGPLAIVGTISASVVFLRRSRQCEDRERVAWTGFGAAFLTGALGMAVIPVSQVLGYAAPAFGWPDSFFIASYCLVLVSLVVLPHGERSRVGRVLDLADGLVGAVSIATLSWTWFFSEYVHRFDTAPLLNRVLGFAYPILDVTFLIIVMMLWVRRSDQRFDIRLLLIGSGMTIQAFFDITFVSSATGATFAEAKPLYALLIAALVCFISAGSMVHRRPVPREVSDRPRPRWAMVAPYGTASVMLAALIDSTWTDGGGDARLLTISSVLVAAIIIGRQFAAIRENAIAVERQRQSLISTVSHELRTPLTSLYGMLELLSTDDGLAQEERSEFLEIATQQARYMGRVVSDLVTLTRGGDELATIKVGDVGLLDIVNQAVAQADRHGSVRLSVPNARVHVDPDRMMQAISNLLTNATKYGASTILIRAEVGRELVIEVHDDGPGVPVKHQLSIWNQFERGAHQYDGRTPGSGIGLAIVSAVARAHEGKASYRDSEHLGGACFWLSVPLPAATVDAAQKRVSPAEAAEIPTVTAPAGAR